MTDLKDRLRKRLGGIEAVPDGDDYQLITGLPDPLCIEAADTITSLEARIAELEGEKAEALDREFCCGAQAALSRAEQSLDAARKWYLDGCGNRRASLRASLVDKGDVQ